MLASVAEHASSPPGMRAKTRGKRSTRDFFDILDLLTGRRFVMVAARATQAVGGAAATKWISLRRLNQISLHRSTNFFVVTKLDSSEPTWVGGGWGQGGAGLS